MEGQEQGLALAPAPEERDRATWEKLAGEWTGKTCSTCWVRYDDVLAWHFGFLHRENEDFGYRGIRAATAKTLARGSNESWRAQNM